MFDCEILSCVALFLHVSPASHTFRTPTSCPSLSRRSFPFLPLFSRASTPSPTFLVISGFKVTRNDSQRRCGAIQGSNVGTMLQLLETDVATMLQRCQFCSKNRRCEVSLVTLPLILISDFRRSSIICAEVSSFTDVIFSVSVFQFSSLSIDHICQRTMLLVFTAVLLVGIASSQPSDQATGKRNPFYCHYVHIFGDRLKGAASF